jgi:ferrous iron transport protein A
MPTLDQLAVGQTGIIQSVAGESALVQRLLELGLIEGEEVSILAVAPLGDPIEVLCGYSRLSMRRREAAGVTVHLVSG